MSLQNIVRAHLNNRFNRVPPKLAATKGVHLEVWASAADRYVGVEFGTNSVGFWIKKMNLCQVDIPEGVVRREKEPKGRLWIGVGEDKKGCNSNLSSYSEFVGAKISHLLVRDPDHALQILCALGVRTAASG